MQEFGRISETITIMLISGAGYRLEASDSRGSKISAKPNGPQSNDIFCRGTTMILKPGIFALAILACVFACVSMASGQQTTDSQLIEAAKTEDISAMNAALAAGANVKATGQYTMTALQWACKNNHPQAVRLLLSKGADVKQAEPYYHQTCIDLTSNPIIVKLALEAGADPSAAAIGHLLNLAVTTNTDPVFVRNVSSSIKELLDAGADPNYSPGANTYLDSILINNLNRPLQLTLLRIFVAAGVDVNFEPNLPGHLGPPLRLALASGNVEAVRILVAAGANVDASALPRPENLLLSPAVLEQMKEILRGRWPAAEPQTPPPAQSIPRVLPARTILTAQSTDTVRAIADPRVIHSPDPVCPGSKYLDSGPKDLGFCTTLQAVLPIGSQFIDATPEARDVAGTGPWVSCPVHPQGAVYPFMDCAVNANGYVRFIETSPTIKTEADGIHVSWQIINWSTKVREGRLTVHYTQP